MSTIALDEIFELVKDRTGYPVSVTPLSDQTSHSSMRSATVTAPAHAIFVNPRYERYANYLVANQCAILLFKWENSKGVPDFVVDNEKANFQKRKIEQRMQKQGIEAAGANRYASAVIDGILMQLNSTPLEILSTRWVFERYESLRDEQELYITAYIRELSESLNPRIREMSPPDIFERNAAMNAAYVSCWSELTENPVALLPYETLGFAKLGHELLSDIKSATLTLTGVYQLSVDAWAERLRMKGWYRWQMREI